MKGRRLVVLILAETGCLALISMILGTIAGVAWSTYLAIDGWDWSVFGSGDLNYMGIAFETIIRPILQWPQVVETNILLLVISLLSALYPAMKAAKLDPARALHH